MSKGKVFPNESISSKDAITGTTVRQVTSNPSIHHHPFYYLPAYDDSMQRLYFVSQRTGTPQIFCELQETGKLVQLTDRTDLNEWSIHPSHNGRHVYYTAGQSGWRVDVETQVEEEIIAFGDVPMREKGMVGAAMGTTTLSRDDCWWAIPVKVGTASRLVVVDTASLDHEIIVERDTVGHPQFHPKDSSLLRYAGPYYERMWVVNRDGTNNRLAYQRDVAKKEWIVHETWLPNTRDLIAVNWPHEIIRTSIDTGAVSTVSKFNAWHPMINRTGTCLVTDTRNPDIGLQLLDLRVIGGEPSVLCYPNASNAGDHWNTDHCPYDDGPIDVFAPQHTHPHPNFSPDDTRVVFTSDSTGYAQVYEALIST